MLLGAVRGALQRLIKTKSRSPARYRARGGVRSIGQPVLSVPTKLLRSVLTSTSTSGDAACWTPFTHYLSSCVRGFRSRAGRWDHPDGYSPSLHRHHRACRHIPAPVLRYRVEDEPNHQEANECYCIFRSRTGATSEPSSWFPPDSTGQQSHQVSGDGQSCSGA